MTTGSRLRGRRLWLRTIGVVLISTVLGIGLRAAWIKVSMWLLRFGIRQEVAGSTLGRWWRCQGVPRPLLTKTSDSWSLSYSWSGGMGPGDVALVLRSDGHTTLTSRKFDSPRPPAKTAKAKISPDVISIIAEAVDESGLLCQTSQTREGYIVEDLGRYTISVVTKDSTKTLTVDEFHTLADTAAFEQVVSTIQELRLELGEPLTWGPYGTASVASDDCAEKH